MERYRKVIAELLVAAAILGGALAGWYDYMVGFGYDSISCIVNKLIHMEPAVAFAFGVIAMQLLRLMNWAWGLKPRYGLALMGIGVVLGHLFWGQK